MDTLELKSGNKLLKFAIGDMNWCQVFFVDNGKETRLGAEEINIILSKLLISFFPFSKKTFNYANMEMFVIVSLMDCHSTIAGKYNDNRELELIFIANEQVLPMITLTEEKEIEWIEEICFFMTKRKNE